MMRKCRHCRSEFCITFPNCMLIACGSCYFCAAFPGRWYPSYNSRVVAE